MQPRRDHQMHFFNITSQKLAHSFTVIHWSRPSLRRVSEWRLNHGSGAFGVSALRWCSYTHEAGRPRSPPNVPIDSVIRVMQIKSIVRRHPRGGATSPARGVQPPSRSYDDVEPDTDVVLKVFKFNISPRCKRRRRESNPQARTQKRGLG